MQDETLVGAIAVSNLYHVADHEFATGSLREYLKCPEYPYDTVDMVGEYRLIV